MRARWHQSLTFVFKVPVLAIPTPCSKEMGGARAAQPGREGKQEAPGSVSAFAARAEQLLCQHQPHGQGTAWQNLPRASSEERPAGDGLLPSSMDALGWRGEMGPGPWGDSLPSQTLCPTPRHPPPAAAPGCPYPAGAERGAASRGAAPRGASSSQRWGRRGRAGAAPRDLSRCPARPSAARPLLSQCPVRSGGRQLPPRLTQRSSKGVRCGTGAGCGAAGTG